MTVIRRLIANETGASSIEYAAIASLISIVAIAAMAAVGTSVIGLFETVPGF